MRKTVILLFLVLALVCQPAFAIDLRTAKVKGLVGETTTGYLAPVKPPSPEVAKLIKTINAKRRQHYQEIARRNGTTLRAVEVLAGKKAIEKTPPGQFIRINGSWRKK
ncbi:MAG TPA: DUF1318 domain-containing protein [Desulfobulbus sp.]|nr:DUF1318 domain-containing protein [Desulfobulbus sp.]